MRIKLEDAKAGDAITWKGNGIFYEILSRPLSWIDYRSHWDRWAWHTGYIVRIFPDGEVVTSQAIAKGVEAVTYPSVKDMGECRIYRWLENPDQEKIDQYTQEHSGDAYDALVYLWVFLGGISMIYLHHPFRVVNGLKMCWENLSEFCRYMGKELQPEEEPCLLSRVVTRLEEK
ncbi:MAG: hypothetical protein Q8O55_01480 [Dehalococcoidales bacterium]|nr:hypothetical protein [Dehalococcoidales bacterium]